MKRLQGRRAKFRSLSVTLSVTFMTLSMGILLIASGLQVYLSVEAQQKIISSQHQLIAQDAAHIVGDFIREKFNALDNMVLFTNLATTGNKERKLILERLLGREASFRQARLLDAHGREVLRAYRLSQAESERLTKRIGAEMLSRVSRGDRYISPVYVDEITGEPMVIMAVPIADVFGDFRGIVLTDTNLKFMWDLVDRIRIGKKGLAYVVDDQGNLIAFRDISRVLKREKVTHLEEVTRSLGRDEAHNVGKVDVSRGILGDYVVSTHVNLVMPDWAVVVETPVQEAYESVIGMAKPLAGVMLLSFIMAAVSGVYFSKKITGPIIKLRDAIKSVSKGDLSARMEIEARDEVGELAGSFNQMVADLHDTTVSVQELKREQKRFQDIAVSTGEWIWEVDAEGRYTYSNPVVEGVLGYKPEELMGRHFYDYLQPDERDMVKQAAFEVFARKEPFSRFVNTNVHKSGRTVIVETSGVPIISAEGALVGYRGVDRDITERKKAEEEKEKLQGQLLQSSKMTAIGTMSGGIAHDFNNILLVIIGNAQLLKMSLQPGSKSYNLVETIETAAHRSAELTQKLLSFSRRTKMVFQTVDLNAVVCEVSALLKRTVEKMISIEPALAPDLLPVMADPTQIYQLILNICINAKEAMMPIGRGRLAIETHNQAISEEEAINYPEGRQGAFAVLTISDTGIGMEEETVKRIFEPFFTTKEVGKSFGLGLAVSYGIIKEHGGFIDVRSEKGKGSCFNIYLPALASGGHVEKEMISKAKQTIQEGHGTILLVDDEQMVRDIGKSILEQFGYQVVAAQDGEAAAAIYKNRKDLIDMVILDLIMPGWGGKETLKALREIDPEVKVLIASGYSSEGTADEVIRMGVNGFIQKPYLIEEILDAVKRILRSDR
jgi:PAS domain S-box-containing protein